jgi:hypothetical protein
MPVFHREITGVWGLIADWPKARAGRRYAVRTERRSSTRSDATVEDGEKVGGSVDRELGLELETVLHVRGGAPKPPDVEGVVAKRLDAPYLPGVRSAAWLKHKHRRNETLLVTGRLIPRRRAAFEETKNT